MELDALRLRVGNTLLGLQGLVYYCQGLERSKENREFLDELVDFRGKLKDKVNAVRGRASERSVLAQVLQEVRNFSDDFVLKRLHGMDVEVGRKLFDIAYKR